MFVSQIDFLILVKSELDDSAHRHTHLVWGRGFLIVNPQAVVPALVVTAEGGLWSGTEVRGITTRLERAEVWAACATPSLNQWEELCG
jgi:hypothetical protein